MVEAGSGRSRRPVRGRARPGGDAALRSSSCPVKKWSTLGTSSTVTWVGRAGNCAWSSAAVPNSSSPAMSTCVGGRTSWSQGQENTRTGRATRSRRSRRVSSVATRDEVRAPKEKPPAHRGSSGRAAARWSRAARRSPSSPPSPWCCPSLRPTPRKLKRRTARPASCRARAVRKTTLLCMVPRAAGADDTRRRRPRARPRGPRALPRDARPVLGSPPARRQPGRQRLARRVPQ